MKIQTIQPIYRQFYAQNQGLTQPTSLECQKNENKNLELSNSFYYPININFKSEGELEALKKLFFHGLPCMYTGVEMLDAKTALKFLSSLHRMTSKSIFEFLAKWEKSFLNPEFITESAKEAYFIIKEQAEKMPESPIKDVLQELRPQYEKELVKQQLGIINTLDAYAYALPEDFVAKYTQLLENNRNRILGKPVSLDFSPKEFQYKLEQIKGEYQTMRDKNAVSVINAILKESKNFSPKTKPKNVTTQRKILIKLEGMFNRSPINKDEAIKNLFEDSRLRLSNKKTTIPFSKKAFLYDLSESVVDLPDKDLKKVIMTIAAKLPTSGDSSTSFIIKYTAKTPDKLIYSFIWPIIATIEHIWPKAIGGPKTDIKNCGGACAKINSDRGSLVFVEQLKKRPATPQNTQKQLDRLIKYALDGTFEKENVPIDYIEGYKKSILDRSQGALVLDTSKLYESGKFPKPEPATEELLKLNLN